MAPVVTMASSLYSTVSTVQSITSPKRSRPFMHLLSTLLNLFGVTVVTWALSRRTASYSCRSLFRLSVWRDYSWPRLCVVLVFMNSWAFLVMSGSLMSGTGLSMNLTTCMLGIYTCIVLYASSKVLIYAFLIEKVWIVWSHRESTSPPTGIKNRWMSPVWRVCIMLLIPYMCIFCLMFYGRIALLRTSDRECDIGLAKIASLPLLSFDLFITFFLTALFIYPLRASSLISTELRKVACRTLLSSAAALVTSAVNIAVLTFLHGHELGWVCLTSCASDVTINALVLFWVTTGTSVSKRPDSVRSPPLKTSNNMSPDHNFSPVSGRGDINGEGRRRPWKPTYSSSVRCTEDDLDLELDFQDALNALSEAQMCLSASDLDSGPFSVSPRGPPVALPASVHSRGLSQRSLVTRPSVAQLHLPSHSQQNRPATGVSNRSSGSGVVVIRPRSSGMQSLSAKNSSPALFTMMTTEREQEREATFMNPSTSEGGMRAGARAFFKGCGTAIVGGGSNRNSYVKEGGDEISVQVSVTTEYSMPESLPYSIAQETRDEEEMVDFLGALERSNSVPRALTPVMSEHDVELESTPRPSRYRSESF